MNLRKVHSVYSPCCTLLYTLCTVHTAHYCTLCVQSILHITVHSVYSPYCTLLYTLCTVHAAHYCTLCVQSILHITLHSVYSPCCTLLYTLCTVHAAHYCTLCVQSILHITVHSMYSPCCTLLTATSINTIEYTKWPLKTFFVNWHSPATLTVVFPCFFLSCKANSRVYLAKTGHGPHCS